MRDTADLQCPTVLLVVVFGRPGTSNMVRTKPTAHLKGCASRCWLLRQGHLDHSVYPQAPAPASQLHALPVSFSLPSGPSSCISAARTPCLILPAIMAFFPWLFSMEHFCLPVQLLISNVACAIGSIVTVPKMCQQLQLKMVPWMCLITQFWNYP